MGCEATKHCQLPLPAFTGSLFCIACTMSLEGIVSKRRVILVDNANNLFRDKQDDAFDLIEAFLTQFHHWLGQRKPCHLCFQIESSAALQKVFAMGYLGR
jgi:hypothetical protein